MTRDLPRGVSPGKPSEAPVRRDTGRGGNRDTQAGIRLFGSDARGQHRRPVGRLKSSRLFVPAFPAATPDQLLEGARVYAYGGCVIQDLGYYPFGSHFFSNLLHYVRSAISCGP